MGFPKKILSLPIVAKLLNRFSHASKKTFLSFLAILVFATLGIIKVTDFTRAEVLPGEAILYFEGNSDMSTGGETYHLMVESGSPVGFIAVKVVFDESQIALTDEIQTSSLFATLIDKSTPDEANATGEVNIVIGLSPDDFANPPSGIFEIGSLHFSPLSSANSFSNLGIDIESSQIVAVDANALSLDYQVFNLSLNPTPTPTLEPTITLTITPSISPTPIEVSPTITVTPSPTEAPTPTPTEIPSVTPTPTLSPSPTPSASPTPQPESGTTELALVLATPQVVTESEVNIDLTLTTTESLSGVDAVIRYDSAYLNYASVDDKQLLAGNTVVQNDASAGELRLSQLENTGESFVGSGTLATLTFTAVKAGTTDLQFAFTPGETTDSNTIGFNSGQDVLDSVTNADIIIVDRVYLQVKLTTPQLDDHIVSGQVTLEDGGWQENFTTNTEGESTSMEVDSGFAGQTLPFRVKVSGYLRKFLSTFISGGLNILDFGSLVAGDLNDDGIINNLDLGLLYSDWSGSGVADLNDDGIVNSLDHWLLTQNFFKVDD